MAGSQIPTGVTIIQSLSGFQAVSLTEFTTSAAPSIAAGSKVEIAGAFFQFVSDDAINASSWTAITTGTTAYIQLTPSGTAGSQIATASYTSTAPTWRDDLQGWYASAASSTRVIASVYKAEATSYQKKRILNILENQYMLFGSDWDSVLYSNYNYSAKKILPVTTGSYILEDARFYVSDTSLTKTYEYQTLDYGVVLIRLVLSITGTVYVQIYKNGSAYGIPRTSSGTFDETISIIPGDLIQIYGYYTGSNSFLGNIYILYNGKGKLYI